VYIFVCKSITLANYLIENGCNIRKIDKDNLNHLYMVFLFDKTDKLNEIMKKWSVTKGSYENESTKSQNA
jgi:hypothetical protein